MMEALNNLKVKREIQVCREGAHSLIELTLTGERMSHHLPPHQTHVETLK